MSTYNALKYNVPFGSAGGLIALSTQTASSSASVSFTSGIDSTYSEYLFLFNNIHPATDFSSLQFNFSTDSGSNYNVTKTTTGFQSAHNESDSATLLQYLTGLDLAQSTSYQSLNENSGNDNDQAISGYMHLFEPSSTTFVKHYISQMHTANGGEYATNIFTAGYGNTTSAVDAIDFKMSSGNIDSGTIQMFGVVK